MPKTTPINGFYERPETFRLRVTLPELKVLDAGCGSGAHAAELMTREAIVTGIDKSSGMLALARERLGNAAAFSKPTSPRHYPSPTALLIACWRHSPFITSKIGAGPCASSGAARAGGKLVISTHHPFCDHVLAGGHDYFGTFQLDDRWEKGGESMEMRYWRRPLHAMTEALSAAGFMIEIISEPRPLPEARERFPADYRCYLPSRNSCSSPPSRRRPLIYLNTGNVTAARL